jgi:hypothetical protein
MLPTQPITYKEKEMGKTERSAEFEKFAKGEGQEVVNGVVPFEDESAARAFDQKAYKAGFQTVVTAAQAKWIHGKDDSADAPKEWGVTLLN